MNTVTITDLKKRGAKSLSDDDTSILIVNSKPKSAIVPIKEYQMLLEALEEKQDAQDIKDRQEESTLSSDDFFDAALK